MGELKVHAWDNGTVTVVVNGHKFTGKRIVERDGFVTCDNNPCVDTNEKVKVKITGKGLSITIGNNCGNITIGNGNRNF